MSILMEALKQQGPVTAPAPTFWRNLALILALLLAVLSGFVAGYFLLSSPQPAASAELASPQPVPASVSTIVSALSLTPPPAATPVVNTSPATQTVAITEILPAEPPVVTVTAPSAVPVRNATPAPEPEVSPELRDRFASALAASAEIQPRQPAVTTHNAPAQDISMLDPILLQQIPKLRFEAHVFATASAQRWVKVNGRSLQEGQWITADIRLREITPHYVLLEFGQTLFSMRALSEW